MLLLDFGWVLYKWFSCDVLATCILFVFFSIDGVWFNMGFVKLMSYSWTTNIIASSITTCKWLLCLLHFHLLNHYNKMWVEFTSPHSMNRWIHMILSSHVQLDDWIHSKSNESTWQTKDTFFIMGLLKIFLL